MEQKIVNYSLCSIPVPFRLSWGKIGYSRHVFITLADKNGNRGIGEGVLYKTTHLDLLPFLEGDEKNIDEPALDFAIDTAKRDLDKKILTPQWSDFSVTEEFFIDQKIVKKNIEFVKLKVGADLKKDKEAINEINRIYNGKVKIKLDANRGYFYKQALEMANWGIKNNVILFEEPINGSFAKLRKFKEETKIHIMLDESVMFLDDLKMAISSECFDVLNVKLTRVGGITKANEYVKLCQEAGIKISVGCSEELEVGMAAIYTFAKSVKNLYGVEGFGTERLKPYLAKQLIYRSGIDNKQLFLIKEVYGIWKTRFDNLLTRIGNLARI